MSLESKKRPLKIALVDDHKLFRKGLISLIDVATNKGTEILFEADNGLDMKEKIDPDNQPDILLMDVNMPKMDGFECVKWLNQAYPLVQVLVVSMIEKEESIVKMLRLGVKGYLGKDVEPAELKAALQAIADKGFYYTDFITGKLIHSIKAEGEEETNGAIYSLNEREREFLRLACSELTYNDIAAQMFLSPKTIDGYRGSLFEKLGVKTRVGLALYAVKHELVSL